MHHHSLLKLFFLASTFFLSACTLAKPASLFCVVVTTLAEPAAAKELLATSCWSWPLVVVVTLLMSATEEGIAEAAPGVSLLLVWPTFRAVVDSEIAPVLNLGFGLAWIPV